MAEVKIPGAIPQTDGSYAVSVEFPQLTMAKDVLLVLAELAGEGLVVHPTTAQKVMVLGIEPAKVSQVIERLESAGAQLRKAATSFQPRTCVGAPFCKLALKETFPLAQRIYESFKGHPVPHKFKVAVSGCPACCSWANNIDLGFVAVRNGYKVYLGGKGGYKPRPGLLLGLVEGEDEALRVMDAVLKFFNEHGRPKRRFAWVVEKMGLEPLMATLKETVREG